MPDPAFRCIKYDPITQARGTIFFISSFRTKVWYYQLAIKRLVDCGFQVYAYDYHWRPLLEAYPHEWVEFSGHIKDDISFKIIKERSQHPERRFGIIGVSVGATIALHAAKLLADIDKIMLVTTYGSMAKHLWEHPLLGGMRDKCKSLDLDLEQTSKLLGYFEPSYKLDLIGGRRILLFVNEADPVICYANTEVLINEAKKRGIRLILRQIEASRHSITIIKVFKSPGAWLPFFAGLQHEHYPAFYEDSTTHITNKELHRSPNVTI